VQPHRKTKIRSPEENGKLERNHRTDHEEFYGLNRFVSIQHCIELLRQWEQERNEDRPHMALKGKTPKQNLIEKLKNHISKQALISPIKSVQLVG
jgi:transposase InsO family protein